MLILPVVIVALSIILGERCEVILFQGLGILTSGGGHAREEGSIAMIAFGASLFLMNGSRVLPGAFV